jgi:hypothetical protein
MTVLLWMCIFTCQFLLLMLLDCVAGNTWFANGARPQISSENCKSANLRKLNIFLDLRTFRKIRKFADLRFAGPFFFVICGLKTSQVRKNCIKCSISKLYKIKKTLLLGLFWDRVVQSIVEIFGFAICGLIMKICRFAFCGLAHLSNLQICDSGMSLRICAFAICEPLKKFACPPLLIWE